MAKTKTLRVVSIKVAGDEVYHIEQKNTFGTWEEFQVLGVTPRFKDQDQAVDYVKQWEGSDRKKVVQEFEFLG